MERLIALGRCLFAAAVIALGVENIVCAHSREVVIPALPWLPPNPALAFLTGIALIAAGLCIAINFNVRLAAVFLGIFLLLCLLILRVPVPVAQPFDLSIRTTVFEILSLCAAALTLARSLPQDRADFQHRKGPFELFLRSGRYLFAISSVVFGISHFLAASSIATLIPAWIPARLFWAYFTGAAFVAAGLGIATSLLERLAATLLGLMFMLWFLIVHLPQVLSAPRAHNPNEWSSAFIALGMCGASWILAQDGMRGRQG